MKIERRLSEGIGGWLMFEQHCNKSGLFSERYMSFPIGQILSSIYGSNVHAEYIHPILKNHTIGRGAKPKVDFAVLDDSRKPILAIETKWIGNTQPSVKSIMWDVLRLGLLACHFEAECIFLIGGRKKKLLKLFESDDFYSIRPKYKSPVLQFKSMSVVGLPIITGKTELANKWYPILKNWQGVEFPRKLRTQLFKPFPSDCKMDQFQIFGWRIKGDLKNETFIPKETNLYGSNEKN